MGLTMSQSPSYDVRAERGRLICELGDQVRRLDSNTYAVRSQSGQGEYQVTATEAGWTCSYPDSSYRELKCKHVLAVEFSKKIRTAVELGQLAPFETTQGCIYCGSKHLIKDGKRYNKGSDLQIYYCLDCLRYFTWNIGFEKMKHNPKAITTALRFCYLCV